jgi:hypothetical protein
MDLADFLTGLVAISHAALIAVISALAMCNFPFRTAPHWARPLTDAVAVANSKERYDKAVFRLGFQLLVISFWIWRRLCQKE